ncbi:hypothetical protein GCM10017783_23050 [Deinococcus piscis]|uniref:Uncharacterized protein n=1 Tax=Deinococcus piscis TaxID=394230 RepID=A0ABQ3KAX9_9DEIO|nr:hypothetical protein [Deinococcus piscis]GHG09930.1 hypothetical protein GCM10017783_23050 [Deinococcus piscis]
MKVPHITSLIHSGQLTALIESPCPAFSAIQCLNGYTCDDFAGNAFVLSRRPGSPGSPTGGVLAGPMGTFTVPPLPERGFWTVSDLTPSSAQVPLYRTSLRLELEVCSQPASPVCLPENVQLEGNRLSSHSELNIFAPDADELRDLLTRVTPDNLSFAFKSSLLRAASQLGAGDIAATDILQPVWHVGPSAGGHP